VSSLLLVTKEDSKEVWSASWDKSICVWSVTKESIQSPPPVPPLNKAQSQAELRPRAMTYIN
jgi:isopentenyldiphosphate isomerase